MSQEWLKQLAELSNDKDLRQRAQQLHKQQRAAARTGAAGGRSLLGAAFGHFFRWLFLLALAEAAAMFVVTDSEGLQNAPYGEVFHYLVWYPLTQPIFPDDVYAGLQAVFGLTLADLKAFYDRINPALVRYEDALVFAAPPLAALALTLFFLPAINARRRGSPVRFLAWLANWAVLFLYGRFREAVGLLWLAALALSFVGGGLPRAARPPRPQPRQQAASQQSRPAVQPRKAAAALPASAVERSARPAIALNKREPTVIRRGGGNWIRAR